VLDVTRSMVQGATLCAALMAGPAMAVPVGPCPAMPVSAHDLEQVLDQTLGKLRSLVDQRSVTIEPSSSACYVHLSLASSVFAPSGGSCRLDACSVVITQGRSIALQPFDVAGCDPLFSGFGLSRHVPSTFVDASSRIRAHCGADGYEIERVSVVRGEGPARLQFEFRPQAPVR